MDLYVAGVQTYDDVLLPVSFGRVLFDPFSRVRRMSEDLVRWEDLYRPYPVSAYAEIREMVAKARAALSTLPDAEDGAMDAEGNLVFIESLVLQDQLPGFNCSGFAKWVCDGIVGPATGEYLPIEALKEKHLDLRGHQWSRLNEDERDPYFGLDWSRNLARYLAALEERPAAGRSEVAEASGPAAGHAAATVESRPAASGSAVTNRVRETLPHPEAQDVRSVPFSRYVEDVGYPVDELPRILYFLARSEPGNFYIASLNREFGEQPTLRQHVHVAVIFPYFSEEGRFRVSVMERNLETSLDSLERRYGENYIHLVRARAQENFVPPRMTRPD
jgi:hypothetical protein